MSTRLLAHLALFVVALFYAGNYLIAKMVMNDNFVGPLGFVLLRVSFATTLFWMISLFLRQERIERRDWTLFAICGLTGVAANQSLFMSGLELTTPAHASLIMTVSPILVLLFSYLILKDRITSRKIGGILLGCAGAVVLMTFGKEVVGSPDYLAGDIMVLLNATSYALYLVLVKQLTDKYMPLTVIKYVFAFGLLYVLPLGFMQVAAIEWYTFSTSTWLSVMYVLIFVTFLAYLLNIYALRKVKAATVGFYIYLQPLLATMLSVMFDMEELSFAKVFSGILIFIGVYLVSDFKIIAPLSADIEK
jgi:drug/metabolite transporter (DMT)-like permease